MAQMKVVDERTDLAASVRREPAQIWPITVVILFLGLVWFEAVRQLKPEWSFNPQYSYGWSVPFLAAYLFWRRWPSRPVAEPASGRLVAILSMFVLALAVFPIRFLAEANPDWRFLSWAIAIVSVALSMLAIFVIGGRPWARYFAFPILFFLIAVPWPTQIEQIVIQNLMRAVTSINVTLLQLLGIPALQHGNVIEVGSGLIGIEEACSGVRSLQATLMISLFLGELYLFTPSRRILLIVAGAALAFVCNVVRTALLVWTGARNGAHSIEAWHDPAGFTILIVCLFGLWLISLKMRRSSADEVDGHPAGNDNAQFSLFARVALPLAIVLLLSEAGVQIWYRAHAQRSISRWTVSWPSSEPEYQQVPIAPESAALLQYSSGGGASWQGPDGRHWMMYFFNWLPGRTAALFVKIHRPDVCLPASGLTLERDNGIKLLSINGVNLPVRSYRFDDHGIPLHVFYCYWDARSNYENVAAAEEEDWSAQGRVRAALRGRREVGAQMLEIIVWNYDDDALANDALQQQLAAIVHKTSA
jgi:exosortase